MKNYLKDWQKSLNLPVRFKWATIKQQEDILVEIKFQRLCARVEARKDIEKALLSGRMKLGEQGLQLTNSN